MSEQVKKISFGFSKSTKKPATLFATPKENNVQYIEYVEQNSIKLIGDELITETKPLVIPMKNENVLRDSMIAAVESRTNNQTKSNSADVNKIFEKNDEEMSSLTLEQLAAKEILEESTKIFSQSTEEKIYSVPLTSKVGEGQKESTLDDYENVPVSDFGLAMLRGMGWKPDEGVGKSKKIVRPSSPVLRPKGMGLGADKVIKKISPNEDVKDLVIKKGSLIKIIAGPNKHLYGKVEGLDEDSGRFIVKLAIEGATISLSEFMVSPVSKEDYSKNANVINVVKYNEYKSKENADSSLNANDEVSPQGTGEDKEIKKESKESKRVVSRISSQPPSTAKREHQQKISSDHRDSNRLHTSRKEKKKEYCSDSDNSSDSSSSTRIHSKKHKKHKNYSKESHSRHKKKSHRKRKYRSRSRS